MGKIGYIRVSTEHQETARQEAIMDMPYFLSMAIDYGLLTYCNEPLYGGVFLLTRV